MNTNLTNSQTIKDTFSGLFANRTDAERREDAAQLLSFRFLSEIERLMEERQMTRKQLAQLVGTSASYVTQLFRGDRLVNIDMLARFEQALSIRFVATKESEVVALAKPSLKKQTAARSSATSGRTSRSV